MSDYPNIDLETSITEFLERGKVLLEKTLTVEQVFNEVTARYRDQRIDGAMIDSDGDMLLLEWGESQLMQTAVPKDLRDLHGGSPEWFSDKVPHISIARQVYVETDNSDDFDGNAVAMHIDLGFTEGAITSSNHWVESPVDIEAGRSILKNNNALSTLWTMPASRVAIFVGTVG